MKSDKITITSPSLGRCSGFIYCIYIMNPKPLVYIGETAAKNGPLGRLSSHMQVNGTFVKRCENSRVDITKIDGDITMLAINLETHPVFCGDINKSNRCALEYFVNLLMEEYSVADETTIPFDVISKTKIANRLALNNDFMALANEIAKDFYIQLPFK